MSRNRAIFELIIAGSLWGFGFIATLWALKAFTPFEVMVYRYLIAFLVGELLWFVFFKQKNQSLNILECVKRPHMGFVAGFFLAALMILQTIGLLTTSAAKSAFITTLYILFVPLLAPLFHHFKTTWINIVLALLALGGTFLLTGANLDHITTGDLLTLGCSVMAALHILYIDKVSDQIIDDFRFNNFQTLGCLLSTLLLWPFQDKVSPLVFDFLPWAGILCLSLGSSMIAFTIQIRSQKVLEPTTASMLFLVESPFALIFGILLLHEHVSLIQALGASIILVSSFLSIWFGKKPKTNYT